MSGTAPSGGETGGAARLLASARERLSVAAADLALPEPLRLSEWQLSTVSALLDRLVRNVEDELRAALATRFAANEQVHAALTSAHVAIALPILDGSESLSEPVLIAALLRRAEEHRHQRGSAPEAGLLLELSGDEDEGVAGEAMALLVGQSGRLDRFQEPVMARTELDAEAQHRLVWAVAAALRHYLVHRQYVAEPEADRAVAGAAGALLAAYDEGERVDAVALRLAARLARRGRLDDILVARSAAEGNLPLFLAALSVRSGLDQDSVWEIFSAPGGEGVALILRAAAVARDQAASILLRLDPDRVEEGIDRFDTVDESDARDLLSLWQADPAYRSALARLRQ
ncbi:MAG TPA: DUF2336 domain-containing protein [Allosphingosinicella sp.]|nr:DUF2336 domain-containing protein [Allosphingosinicella sp.]